MGPSDDAIDLSDVARIRQSLQANVARLMDVGDHLARQVAALDAAERHVRAIALRETTRSLEAPGDPEECARLGELQARTNADFRQMRETHALLGAQIDTLLRQHEALYEATFAPDGTGRP
jgi:hypothetical protein